MCASATPLKTVRLRPPPDGLPRVDEMCPVSKRGPQTRSIELDVDIGADARDWAAIQAAEKLKPVEIELRRIEEVTGEIVKQMEYLRRREQKLRDTNESTNERVKWFAFAVMATLVGLGGWQVVYLRAYFRYDGSRLRRWGGGTDVRIGQSILFRRGCFGGVDVALGGRDGFMNWKSSFSGQVQEQEEERAMYNFPCLLDLAFLTHGLRIGRYHRHSQAELRSSHVRVPELCCGAIGISKPPLSHNKHA